MQTFMSFCVLFLELKMCFGYDFLLQVQPRSHAVFQGSPRSDCQSISHIQSLHLRHHTLQLQVRWSAVASAAARLGDHVWRRLCFWFTETRWLRRCRVCIFWPRRHGKTASRCPTARIPSKSPCSADGHRGQRSSSSESPRCPPQTRWVFETAWTHCTILRMWQTRLKSSPGLKCKSELALIDLKTYPFCL